jgi:uncharacterized protein YkwD
MKKLRNVLSIGLLVVTVFMISATQVKAATTVKLSNATVEAGKTYTMSVSVNGKKTTKATWKSSNTALASVSSAGKITAKKAGTATLTATVSGKSATCKLTVKASAYVNNSKNSSTMEARANANITAYNTYIQDVVKYTNQYRARHGVRAVTLDKSLTFVASYRSTEMAQRDILSHTRPDGSKFYDLAKSYGITYRYIGENIGAYHRSAKEVVDGWYASPSHKANMLSANYSKIGVGVGMTSDHYYYWTQIFKN